MGQNGAGKSTLIKVLTGVCAPDSGTLELDGRRIPARFAVARAAARHQHGVPGGQPLPESHRRRKHPGRPLSAAAVVARRGIDWQAVDGEARRVLGTLQLDIDVTRLLSAYPVAVQQMVAIARATSVAARVLILDEPTSSLDADEVRQLFALLDRLRRQGMAILFITHFLAQVYAISDRITVLRNGRFVGEHRTGELTRAALIVAMVGRALASTAGQDARSTEAAAEPVLYARALGRKGQVQPTDIDFNRGEIVGIAGLLGSGRTELARLLFGLDSADSGEVVVNAERVLLNSPADAVASGSRALS